MILCYSYLKDSTGSWSEALFAGMYPKRIPIKAETPNETTMDNGVTIVSIPVARWIMTAKNDTEGNADHPAGDADNDGFRKKLEYDIPPRSP